MQSSVDVISDVCQLVSIEDSWNRFVRKHCETPFLLSRFVEQSMEHCRSTKWCPFILVISANGQIVGIAPFVVGKRYGIPWVKFLHRHVFSPELVIDDQHRQHCIGKIIDYLFETSKYKIVDLTLPTGSPNIPVITNHCEAKHVYSAQSLMPEYAHRILPVTCDWNTYETRRGSNFRNKFRKMERKYKQVGSFKAVCFQNPDSKSGVLEKVIDVEKASWKEDWRKQKGDKTDPELLLLWESAEHTAKNEPGFKWKIWFLEHDNHEVAYSLILEYRQNAFIAKITYDQRYRRFYPGIYLINTAIRQLFNEGEIKKVDFQTDISFMDTWTRLRQTRQRVMMGKGVLPAIIEAGFTNESLSRLRRKTIDLVATKLPSINRFNLLNVR